MAVTETRQESVLIDAGVFIGALLKEDRGMQRRGPWWSKHGKGRCQPVRPQEF